MFSQALKLDVLPSQHTGNGLGYINPLHPHISMHFLFTVVCISRGANKENLFKNQVLL